MAKMLRVTWIDSAGDDGTWLYKKEVEPMQPAICESVGFLVERTDECLTLAANSSPTQLCARICIPIAAIKEIAELRKSKTLEIWPKK